MTRIPLGRGAYKRTATNIPEVKCENRYFESDPTNLEDEVSLVTRPAVRKWLEVGSGPIRGIYSQPGTFDEALFTVSSANLYKIATDETTTNLGSIVTTTGAVSFAATDDPYLFLCDGGVLWLYSELGLAQGTLTASGAIANGDTVTIGTVYYQWTNGSVDTGTPAGTVGSPWLVALGASNTEALANLLSAINDTGTEGTTYSTVLTPHADVIAISSTSTTVIVRARETGTGGNSIATTETGANIAWGGATLSGGGSATLTQVPVPDDLSIVSVGYIASFVICVCGAADGFNGRFFWIEPFETTIDPLNFATAEKAPDPVHEVVVEGGQFWLPGSSTTEVWYPTGDELLPFLSQQGRHFDQPIWPGTIVKIKNTMLTVGTDGQPYKIVGGQPVPIGGPGVVQRFREAINAQRAE